MKLKGEKSVNNEEVPFYSFHNEDDNDESDPRYDTFAHSLKLTQIKWSRNQWTMKVHQMEN